MNFIKKLFRIKPNDWIIVWTESAWWEIKHDEFMGWPEITTTERVFYSIEWSEYRNKYRLKTKGHKPYEHQYYGIALAELSLYQKQGHIL